nr:callose synthase 11-like [Ipomoea batatas]
MGRSQTSIQDRLELLQVCIFYYGFRKEQELPTKTAFSLYIVVIWWTGFNSPQSPLNRSSIGVGTPYSATTSPGWAGDGSPNLATLKELLRLLHHSGEIRNIEQLRLRFQFFASALQFNLMPEDQRTIAKATLVQKLWDAIHRLKLRYGFGQPYKKIESSQVEATRICKNNAQR